MPGGNKCHTKGMTFCYHQMLKAYLMVLVTFAFWKNEANLTIVPN